MFELHGKTAIVTGAGRGIGAGIAQGLARAGATVIATDLDGAATTVAALHEAGSTRSVSVALDVTDGDAVERIVRRTAESHGAVDIFVNNAGIHSLAPVADVSDEEVRHLFEVNVFGVLHGMRAASAVMKAQGSGRIVNIASQQGKVARVGTGAYSASKAAVLLLTQAAALELANSGVTANAVCPGTIFTPALEEGTETRARVAGLNVEAERLKYIDDNIPVGRYGTADDVAQTVVWLASDEASFVTGASINVTGAEQVFF